MIIVRNTIYTLVLVFLTFILIPSHVQAAIGDACTVDTSAGTDTCTVGLCDEMIGECICVIDDDCNIGESCLAGECIALTSNCTKDADCADGERCDIVNGGLCVPYTPPPSGDTSGSGATGVLPELQSLNKLSVRNIDDPRIAVPTLIGQAVRFFTGIFGSIALVMIIYGGFQLMIASGDKEKFKQGTKIIAWASIGLVTMMLSYVLVSFVLGAF